MKGTIVLAVLALSTIMLHVVVADEGEKDQDPDNEDDNVPRMPGPLLERNMCHCRRSNWCDGKTGENSIGCRDINLYIECENTACSLHICNNETLWNSSVSECTPCPAGLHVDTRNHRCVCDEGTTWDSTSLGCVKCPTGATFHRDSCKCLGRLILNEAKTACVACPTDAKVEDDTCKCHNSSLFFNAAVGLCQDCPGTWVPSKLRYRHPICQCKEAGYIFDRKTVSCFLCPVGTTSVVYNSTGRADNCRCNIAEAKFVQATGRCNCPHGKILNMPKRICERIHTTLPSEITHSTTVQGHTSSEHHSTPTTTVSEKKSS